MNTPIETNGYTHNGMEYDDKIINSIGAERAKEIKERVDAELVRRRFYGSEYSVDATASQYTKGVNPNWAFNEDAPESGDRIQEIQGRKIISPLLMICDLGDLMETNEGNVIPDDFQYERIIQFLSKLESEPVDGVETSCRSACTGLCVGTCGNLCDGCTDQCTNMCTSNCGSCTGSCGGCSGTCAESCSKTCTGECGGQCIATCFTQCKNGCHYNCEAACGGGCNSGCSGNCKGSANASTSYTESSCVDCFALCDSGCKTECTGTCGGNCKNATTSGNDSTETATGTITDVAYLVVNDTTSNAFSPNTTNQKQTIYTNIKSHN